jgi:hypothetical protein
MLASRNPSDGFTESCCVIVANLRGCAIRLTRSVQVGTAVWLHGLPGRSVSALVVSCISLGQYEKLWLVGLALDVPGNVWGIEAVPEDWAL